MQICPYYFLFALKSHEKNSVTHTRINRENAFDYDHVQIYALCDRVLHFSGLFPFAYTF